MRRRCSGEEGQLWILIEKKECKIGSFLYLMAPTQVTFAKVAG